jgi:hypothetical protein
MKAMVREQEQELFQVQHRCDLLAPQHAEAKRSFEKTKQVLDGHLRTKEQLFLKLQKL